MSLMTLDDDYVKTHTLDGRGCLQMKDPNLEAKETPSMFFPIANSAHSSLNSVSAALDRLKKLAGQILSH